MRLAHHLPKHLARRASLTLGLAVVVLAALWQYTAAGTAADIIPVRSTPKPSATPSPITTSVATPRTTPRATPTPQATISDPASLTVVINKQRALPITYTPTLVVPNVPLRYSSSAQQSHLRPEAATAMEQLFAAAQADGLSLALISGYRSGTYQQTLYANALKSNPQSVVDQGLARPGHSEHQTGLAADIGRSDGTCDIAACFATTPEGQWVAAHAAEYGFIVRYPASQQATTGYKYEPWHLRYVGADTASNIAQTSTTLESYFGLPAAPSYQ